MKTGFVILLIIMDLIIHVGGFVLAFVLGQKTRPGSGRSS